MKNYYNSPKIEIQAILGKWILKFIYKTNIWDIRGEENYKSALNDNKSIIISCWHGQLLTPFMHLANDNHYGLVGTNKDGEIISRIGNKLGWNILRGSSSHGGSRIFVELVRKLNNPPCLIAITPDGPKGPEKIPKPGVIRAAQKTGSFIIPVSVYSTKNWKFINWHTFYLEKPFGKIYLEYGKPIYFDKSDDFSLCEKRLINAMNEVEKENTNYAKGKIN